MVRFYISRLLLSEFWKELKIVVWISIGIKNSSSQIPTNHMVKTQNLTNHNCIFNYTITDTFFKFNFPLSYCVHKRLQQRKSYFAIRSQQDHSRELPLPITIHQGLFQHKLILLWSPLVPFTGQTPLEYTIVSWASK